MVILDNFDRPDGVSRLGTRWVAFTDSVMGGLSSMEAWHDAWDGERCLRMDGLVRLENRGGFIQVALPLATGGHPFDARHLAGLSLRVRGARAPFRVHLRTADQQMPWEHFSATAWSEPHWQDVHVPFSAFRGVMTRHALRTSALVRLGIVLSEDPGPAGLAVSRVGFAAA